MRKKINKKLPFILINSDGLDIKETRHFVVINKKILDKKIERSYLLDKIVEDYKNERSIDLYN